MSRLTRKAFNELTPEQQEVFNMIVANRPVKPEDGHIGGPFDIWLRSPEMGRLLVELGGFFRFRSSVERRYIEVTILVTGAHYQAQFEWYAHEPMARKAGVPDEIIAAIRQKDTPSFTDEGDQLAYQLTSELHQTHELDAATYKAAVKYFGEQGVAELIALAGFYAMVSLTLNGFDVELPDGAELPFRK